MLLPNDLIAQRRRLQEGTTRRVVRYMLTAPRLDGPMVVTVGNPDGLRLLSCGWVRAGGDSALCADELLTGGYPVEIVE